MKSLRKWIEECRYDGPARMHDSIPVYDAEAEWGWSQAMEHILKELQVREEQAKEDNWKAAKDGDHLAGLLHEVESSLESLSDSFDECVLHAEKDEYYVHVESASEELIHASVAAQKLKEQAERWRSLFVDLLSGEMTHKRRAELIKDLGIKRAGKP